MAKEKEQLNKLVKQTKVKKIWETVSTKVCQRNFRVNKILLNSFPQTAEVCL